MSAEGIVVFIVALLGSGGVGAWIAIPYTKRKTRAEVACKEAEAKKLLAEAAHVDENRMAKGVETLTAIIEELNGTLSNYQSRLTEQQKQLDQAIEQSSSVGDALKQARKDLGEHSRTIDRLRARIKQLEKTLTEHGIPIPKERRLKGGAS